MVEASARDQAKARQLRRGAFFLLKLFSAMVAIGITLLVVGAYIFTNLPLWLRLYALEVRKLHRELTV